MELTETINSINKQLVDLFGIHTETGDPMFRVVWAQDQFEKRETEYTDAGLKLLYPIVKLLPKYQWIKERYVLERLVIVPELQRQELAGIKLSYEPLWIFQGNNEQYVPPTIWACKFIIDTMYAALGKKSLARYKDPEVENPIEVKRAGVDELYEKLYGDESSLNLKTVTGEAVAYTGPTPFRLEE